MNPSEFNHLVIVVYFSITYHWKRFKIMFESLGFCQWRLFSFLKKQNKKTSIDQILQMWFINRVESSGELIHLNIEETSFDWFFSSYKMFSEYKTYSDPTLWHSFFVLFCIVYLPLLSRKDWFTRKIEIFASVKAFM